MRNALLTALLTLACTACGAYQFPGQSPEPSSGPAQVTGTVRSVPCAPVEQAGESCAGKPVPNVEIDYVAGSSIVQRTKTSSSGTYAVNLPAGSYVVKFNTYMRVIGGPTKLTVAEGARIVANYTLDNGIRVPVPAEPAST
jgi:hypothetical protein